MVGYNYLYNRTTRNKVERSIKNEDRDLASRLVGILRAAFREFKERSQCSVILSDPIILPAGRLLNTHSKRQLRQIEPEFREHRYASADTSSSEQINQDCVKCIVLLCVYGCVEELIRVPRVFEGLRVLVRAAHMTLNASTPLSSRAHDDQVDS